MSSSENIVIIILFCYISINVLMGTDAKKIKKWNPIVVQWPITKMSLSPRAHCVALEHKYTGGQKSKQTVRSADGTKYLCSKVQAQGDLAFLLLVRREVVWKQPRPQFPASPVQIWASHPVQHSVSVECRRLWAITEWSPRILWNQGVL